MACSTGQSEGRAYSAYPASSFGRPPPAPRQGRGAVAYLIIMGKPPALPGDPSSLTFPALDDDPSVLLQRSCSAWKERQPVFVDQQLY